MSGLIKRMYKFVFIISLKLLRAYYSCLSEIFDKKRKVVYLLGTPRHNNIGDLAIIYAEKQFIKNTTSNAHVVSIPLSILATGSYFLKKIIKNDDLIIGHGGGNMGNEYMIEEKCRRDFIYSFQKNKIIIFPQTIYFTETKIGYRELVKTQNIYANHSNLTLIATEIVSYDAMLKLFPNNNVMLAPDIVLSLNLNVTNLKNRQGGMTCIRNDGESLFDSTNKVFLQKWILSKFVKINITDTIAHEKLFRFTPKTHVVKSKLLEFSSSKFVLTDRLHGMVMSAITGTPCIAFSNYNHKVLGTYEWLKDLDYIAYCEDKDELDQLLATLEVDKLHAYDPAIFNQYWSKIRELLV